MALCELDSLYSEIINQIHYSFSLSSLQNVSTRLSERELDRKGRKLLAEVNYLLSKQYFEVHMTQEALTAAERAIELYVELDIRTLEEAAPILGSIIPEHIPDYMHEGVVRDLVIRKLTEHRGSVVGTP